MPGLRRYWPDPEAHIWIYSRAASPLPKPAGYQGPDGYFDYLQTVKPEGEHGDAFHYKTINTDALGWIISRVSATVSIKGGRQHS
jgi:CubicO group peptidase (beta-lactamase class C family)